jgi:hypothetical protein
MVLLINIVLVINYYEINKVMKKLYLRFISVIAIAISLSNVIIGIKEYNENVLIGICIYHGSGFVLLIAADNMQSIRIARQKK